MAAGLVTISVLDGAGAPVDALFWSSDGTAAGDLQPVGYIKDGELVALGATADASASSDTGTFSLIALVKRLLSVKLPATLGAKTGAASFSVIGASDGFETVGNVASGAADSGKPVKAGGVYNSTQPTVTAGQRVDLQADDRGNLRAKMTANVSTPADGATNAQALIADSTAGGIGRALGVFPAVYNGSTWDLTRTVVNGLNSVGTGIAAAGVVGQYDDTSPGAVTENQFAPIRITSRRELMVSAAPVLANPTSVLTRPSNTTAYSQNDLVASNTTAGSIVVPTVTAGRVCGGGDAIMGLRLSTNVTTGWGAVNLLVRLWAVAPTYTNGDNGAYAVATGAAGYLGSATIALEQWADGAVGVGSLTELAQLPFVTTSGATLAWDIQILGAATPISGQTFTLTLLESQN